MNLPVSRPVFALLLAAIVASIITTLAPDAVPAPDIAGDLLPDDRAAARPAATGAEDFRRPVYRRPATAVLVAPLPAAVPPPAAPAMPEPPPPAPVAPTPAMPEVPFVYLGRLTGDGRDLVFLGDGEDSIAVAPGARINTRWALERANEDELVLRYLPLNKTTTLRIGP